MERSSLSEPPPDEARVNAHRGLVWKAVHLYYDPAEAEDIEAEGFHALWRGLQHFDETRGTKPSSYLWPTIKGHLAHYIRDHLRTIHIPRRRFGEAGMPYTVALDESDAPMEEFEPAADTRMLVADLLSRLPIEQARVMRLYYLDGFSTREIGEIEGKTAGAISNRLSRARARLRQLSSLDGKLMRLK